MKLSGSKAESKGYLISSASVQLWSSLLMQIFTDTDQSAGLFCWVDGEMSEKVNRPCCIFPEYLDLWLLTLIVDNINPRPHAILNCGCDCFKKSPHKLGRLPNDLDIVVLSLHHIANFEHIRPVSSSFFQGNCYKSTLDKPSWIHDCGIP